MVALQIRGVPDEVRRALADQAARRGQSLQAYLLRVVTDEALRSKNLDILRRFSDRHDGSRVTAEQATDVLDRARTEAESDVP